MRDPLPLLTDAPTVRALAPMYRLKPGSVAEEAHAAAQLVSEVAERLRRLPRAYGEWRTFEPGPYFDLSPAQVALLTRLVERAATVHVVFFLDALLPAFQAVQSCAAQAALTTGSAEQDEMIYTTLTAHWQHMLDVINIARHHLHHDINFLALNSASEEQERWIRTNRSEQTNFTIPWASLERSATPTLTLSIDFPLPAFRQPGRKRRLMRTWQRLYGQTLDRTSQ